MNGQKFSGWLSFFGGGALLGLVVTFALTGWGPPGTAAYDLYELLNRLAALALLLIAGGWFGLYRRQPAGWTRRAALGGALGLVIIAGGTAAEFWLFSDLRYAGASWRQTAYSLSSVGGWLFDLSAMLAGYLAWRARRWPRWYSLVFLLALPLDVAAFIIFGAIFFAPAVIGLVTGRLLLRAA